MSFANRIRSAFQGFVKADQDDSVEKQELRVQQRFTISASNIAEVCFNGESFPVVNLSYSGVAITLLPNQKHLFDSLIHPEAQSKHIVAKIRLVNESVDMTMRLVFCGHNRAGFCFVHGTGDTLLFLRKSIEVMRRGFEMNQMDRAYLKERFQNSEWSVFRNGESDDLRLRKSAVGKLEEALLTFLDGDYCEICFRDGLLTTRRIEQKQGSGVGSSAAAQQNLVNDIGILKSGLLILNGLKSRDHALIIDKFMDEISRHLFC